MNLQPRGKQYGDLASWDFLRWPGIEVGPLTGLRPDLRKIIVPIYRTIENKTWKFFLSRLNSKSSERIEFEIIYSSSGFFLSPKNKVCIIYLRSPEFFTLNVALFIFYVTQFSVSWLPRRHVPVYKRDWRVDDRAGFAEIRQIRGGNSDRRVRKFNISRRKSLINPVISCGPG